MSMPTSSENDNLRIPSNKLDFSSSTPQLILKGNSLRKHGLFRNI